MKYSTAILFLILSSCQKFDESPELKDPIYQDILKQADDEKKSGDALRKTLVASEKDAREAKEKKGELRIAKKKIEEISLNIVKAQQRGASQEFRALKRKAYARQQYKLAFSRGEPWPQASEFLQYQEFKAAQSRSRLWKPDARIKEKTAMAKKGASGKHGSPSEATGPTH